ncbi:MAG TPA: PspC domain-containing protein [Candidatus Limnocylindrales bacterium]
MNPRRLYRSRTDRPITGIAGGMAEYLDVDPTVVRILWVLAAIFSGGLAILLYIVLAFVIPTNPFQGGPIPTAATSGSTGWGQPAAGSAQGTNSAWTAGAAPAWSPDWSAQWEAQRAARAERPGRAGLIIGTVLIVFGAFALADVVLPNWVGGALFGPALLLAIGAALLVISLRRHESPVTATAASAPAATASSTVETPYAPPAAPVTPVASADEADATAPVPYLAESDPS